MQAPDTVSLETDLCREAEMEHIPVRCVEGNVDTRWKDVPKYDTKYILLGFDTR